jgi:hypothetical protein
MNSHKNFLLLVSLLSLASPGAASGAEIKLERVPDAGLQPQIRMDARGVAHLVYLTGDPKAANVQYRRRAADGGGWERALAVNSQPGSAIAVGTIRGAQLALGRNDRPHVVWNGAVQDKEAQSAPMFYSRLNAAGTAFEPQRNLMTSTIHLDGGGSVAATPDGQVCVVWQAGARGGPSGEVNRALYAAFSSDDGATFAAERAVSPPASGACACCGLTALAGPQGDLFIAFRKASTVLQRDFLLLRSTDRARSFSPVLTHPWSVGTCPMSSMSLVPVGPLVWAAWETDGKVFMARLGEGEARPLEVAKGKHPRTATNQAGETLVVWAEGTGWQRGGAVAWQLFAADGRRLDQSGRRDGVPVWSHPAVFARTDGNFVILH